MRQGLRRVVAFRSGVRALGLHLLGSKPASVCLVVNQNNFADLCGFFSRRWIIRISALSTFDGKVLAYHGDHG